MKNIKLHLFGALPWVIILVIVLFANSAIPFNLTTIASPNQNVIVYDNVAKTYHGYALDALAKVSETPVRITQLINDGGFLTVATLPSTSFPSIINRPTTISGYGITDAYNNTQARQSISLTNTGTTGASTYNSTTGVFNIPNYTFPTFTAGTGISISGNVINNTAPNQTVSIASGTGISVTGTYPSFTISSTGNAPTYSNTPARSLNAAGLILSATKPTWVSYSITHTIALTLVTLNGSSNIYLETSANNSTWTTISSPC